MRSSEIERFTEQLQSNSDKKYNCPFNKAGSAFGPLKDQLASFSIQLAEQKTPEKQSLCQKYVDTMNTARQGLESVAQAQASSAATSMMTIDETTGYYGNTEARRQYLNLQAQLQVSSALQGLLNSGCSLHDDDQVVTYGLSVMDGLASTVTLAGFFDPKFFLAGVAVSSISRLGLALARWLLPKTETDQDRLYNAIRNDAFLGRLCIFRNLAYRFDEIDPGKMDGDVHQKDVEIALREVDSKILANEGMSCYLKLDEDFSGYRKLGRDLSAIFENTRPKEVDKCTEFVYALQEKGKETQAARGPHLIRLGLAMGCEKVDPDLPEGADRSGGDGTAKLFFRSTVVGNANFQSARVHDFCIHWQKMLDFFRDPTVSCRNQGDPRVAEFIQSTDFVFSHAATASEAAWREVEDEDLYSSFRKLKSAKDYLEAEQNRVSQLKDGESSDLVQVQSMVTSLGNLMLGEGLTGYAQWNKSEVMRNLENATERLRKAEDGTPQERCDAARYASQRLRQISPRVGTMKKICDVMGAHGEPIPPFRDRTRTFSSIVDLQESPLEKSCSSELVAMPSEYTELSEAAEQGLKDCSR